MEFILVYPRCDSDTLPETDYETESSNDTSSLGPILRQVSLRTEYDWLQFLRNKNRIFDSGIGLVFGVFLSVCLDKSAPPSSAASSRYSRAQM